MGSSGNPPLDARHREKTQTITKLEPFKSLCVCVPLSGRKLALKTLTRLLARCKSALSTEHEVFDGTRVADEDDPNGDQHQKDSSGTGQLTGTSQLEAHKTEVALSKHMPRRQNREGADRRQPERKQKPNAIVQCPEKNHRVTEENCESDFFRPGVIVTSRTFLDARLATRHGRLTKTEVEGILRTHVDAVQTLHAAGVHHHLIQLDFFVHPNVGRARRRAMSTPLTRIGNSDLSRSDLVHHTENAAIGTAIRAKALVTEHVDDEKTADQKR